MELRISDVKFITIQANFEWTFVKVFSGEEYGIGEAGPAPSISAMGEKFKKLIIGEDALKLRRIEEKFRFASLYSGTTTHHVMAGVVNAIYDLIARHLNIPLYKFLGGDRESIRVYVDAHGGKGLEAMTSIQLPTYPEFLKGADVERERLTSSNNPIHGRLSQEKWNEDYTPEAYSKRARNMVKEGFTAMKFDLDVPTPYSKEYNIRSGQLTNKDIDYMYSIMKSVREEVGDEIDVMVDLHWRYDINTAVRICSTLDPLRLKWIEDPVPAQMSISNVDEFRLLTGFCRTPIETGENFYESIQFRELIPVGVRVWAPDIAKTGVTEGRRIAELAWMYDIEFSPHNIGSPIATLFNAHVSSAAGTLGAVEFHGHDLPIWNKISIPEVKIEKGFVKLDDKPGIGVDLNEEFLKKTFNASFS
ncbi:mandelate racemase [Sulfolobales archaeon HS-7]|nr:mandelate racemase [Sulfolobales archaeon HS-7]